MMKKIWSFLFILFLFTQSNAQDAKKIFLNIPDSIVPLLTQVNRADMIDYLESNMKAQVKNRFEAVSEMTVLSPNYIRIQMSSQTAWEMKVLSLNDSTQVIATSTTVCAPVCDSRISFYTTHWESIDPSSYLTLPRKEDFYQSPSSNSSEEFQTLYKKADILFMKATFSEEDEKLTFTYTTPDYLTKKEKEKLMIYLREPLEYKWSGEKFQAP